jgi:hypothetical protein
MLSGMALAQTPLLFEASENWITAKEAVELAKFRKVRPNAVVVRFDFLTEAAVRTITLPNGHVHTFVGEMAPKEWNLPTPLWRGVDRSTGANISITPADVTVNERDATWEIHALGDGFSIISQPPEWKERRQ